MSYIGHERFSLMTRLVTFILFLCFASMASAAPKAELIEFWDDREPTSIMQINHDAWQEILTTYVNDQHPSGINRFDYLSVTSADARKLKEYLASLQSMEPRQLNDQEAKAYWINMFNAVLIDRIIDTYQSGSRRGIRRLERGGLRSTGWGRPVVEVAMQEISLNDIEHGIIRPIWNDPRIHFAISASTLSGANIQKTAFNGENNEELLDKAQAEFFAHPKSVSVRGNRVVLNSVFDWYLTDFAENKRSLLDYIRENVGEETRQAIQGLSRISYEYNWDLNTPDAVLDDDEDDDD